MNTITINRGELTAIPFSITDAANGLAGKRVTWSLAAVDIENGVWAITPPGNRILRKVGGLPGSSADITITSQTAGAIGSQGAPCFINIALADYATLTDSKYAVTLWIDDGAGADRCVTPGGFDMLVINNDVARAA